VLIFAKKGKTDPALTRKGGKQQRRKYNKENGNSTLDDKKSKNRLPTREKKRFVLVGSAGNYQKHNQQHQEVQK